MNNFSKNDHIVLEIEKEIAELLLDKLEHNDLTLERASQIAKFILQSLPENLSNDQVKKIIPKLDDQFFELADIVYKHMNEYEDKYKEDVLQEVNELMKHKHFDQANNLMKQYFRSKQVN